jgi:AraC-like DNA-binding protein
MNRLHFYINCVADRGISAAQVLDSTGLDAATVSQPNFLPTPDQFSIAIGNILDLAEPGIGIDMGMAWNISDFGIFGYALLSCEKFCDNRTLWSRYFPLTSPLLNWRDHTVGGDWWMDIKELFPLGRVKAFAIEEHLARYLKMCPSIMPADDFGFREIQLSYDAPPYSHLYEKAFNCKIKYNQKRDRVLLDSKYLHYKLNFPSEDVLKTCEQECLRMLTDISTTEPLSQRIKRHLIYNFERNFTLFEMADVIGMSTRSLRRQLQAEGTRYQQLIDEVRLGFALKYLQNTDLTPKEICYRVRYSNVCNFRRAMKAWTGKKLSELRRPAPSDQCPQ